MHFPIFLTAGIFLTALLNARVSAVPGMVVDWGSSMNPPANITNLTQVAVGSNHALGLTATGVVTGWGSNSQGELTIPFDLSGVTAVAAGRERSYALKGDGNVEMWPGFGGLFGWSDVTAISASEYQIVGRKSDGTVLVSGGSFPPVGLANVTAVAAGQSHAAALKSDGTVVAWGSNFYGQRDVPAGLTGVTAIAAGDDHTLALRSNGTVAAWGAGMTDTSWPDLGQSIVPAGLTGVTAIAAGGTHSLALKSDGSVVAWGDNSGGQTNVPATVRNASAISAGTWTSAAIVPPVPDIRVFQNNRRALDGIRHDFGSVNPSASLTHTFAIVNYGNASLTGLAVMKDGPDAARFTVSALAATTLAPGTFTEFTVTFQPNATGASFAALHITSNDPDESTLDINLTGHTPMSAATWPRVHLNALQVPPGLTDLTAVSGGDFFAAALRSDGRVIVWGGGDPKASPAPGVWTLKNPDTSDVTGVQQISLGANGGLLLKTDGTVMTIDSYHATATSTLLPAGSGSLAVAAGVNHYLVMNSDGSIRGWEIFTGSPITVPAGIYGSPAMAVGAGHFVAVRNDGIVVAWGSDSHGQSTVPAGLSGVVDVAAGWRHTLALKGDGTVVAWGENSSEQTNVPAGLTGVVAVEADSEISAALKSDGSVVVWGRVSTVPTGLGRMAGAAPGFGFVVALVSPAPEIGVDMDGTVQRDGGRHPFDWVAIGSSRIQTFTITNTGAVALTGISVSKTGPHAADYTVGAPGTTTVAPGANTRFSVTFSPAAIGARLASLHIASNDADESPFDIALTGRTPMAVNVWGWNGSGQTDIPPGLNDVIALEGGYDYCLALRANGTVVAWGGNGYGQSTVPAGLTNVKAIAAGWYHSLALKTDGTVTGWGNNYYQNDVPSGLDTAKAIAAGGSHSLALLNDGTVTGWGLNVKGQTAVPPELSTVRAIAAGYEHSLLIFRNEFGFDMLAGYGSDEFNQLGSPPVNPVAIAAGDYHNLALLPDDTVAAWGRNFGNAATVPPGLGGVMAIAAGGYHSVALKTDGTLAAWGVGSSGQTTTPAGIGLVGGIAAGGSHTLALISPAPEIAVTHGVNRTADGGTVGFGTAGTGRSDARTFTIMNRGAANLTGLAVTKSGPNAADFNVGSLTTTSLVPGATATFTVTFQTASAGNRTAALQIASNDADESSYDLALTGSTTLTPIEAWRQQWFGSPANSDSGWNELDYESDGVLNFVEFAFGTNPTSRASGASELRYTGALTGGGTFTAPGQPVIVAQKSGSVWTIRALFVRHKLAAAAGLTYTPQFSATLGTWTNAAVAPLVLASSGDWEIVSLPLPVIAGRDARFFRVKLDMAP